MIALLIIGGIFIVGLIAVLAAAAIAPTEHQD